MAMKRISLSRVALVSLLAALLCGGITAGLAAGQAGGKMAEGTIALWVRRSYNAWDNPMQSEFSINDKTINIYTSDTTESIAEYLKQGWNTITVKTTPQEPATRNNELIFKIGPVFKDPNHDRMVMTPVLWEFHNGTDWRFREGKYSHPLGPDVKEVSLSFRVYLADFSRDNAELKTGDFVLTGHAEYDAWDAPVTATLFINGTPLNTFLIASRQIVITPLLKQGKNEIKLISTRVKNLIRNNDISLEVAGPAEWLVGKGRYEVRRIVEFRAMQGWSRDPRSGQLINRDKPDSETIERVIPFFLKEAPKATEGGEAK